VNYNETVDDLASRESSLEDLSTDTLESVLGSLGNPHRDYESVLVAGTNGKGSVVEMTSHVLRHRGLSVGSNMSPGLTSPRDRIRVDGDRVSRERFVELYETVSSADRERELSFFECVTAMALLEFSRRGTDCAVVEVGIGGGGDATSVIDNTYSAVTGVSLDHTDTLGNTRREIAGSLAGVEGERNVAASQLVRQRMGSVRKPVELDTLSDRLVYRGQAFRLPVAGSFQRQNLGVVLALLEEMGEVPEDIAEAFSRLTIPGRMEVVSSKPLVIHDGAHNPPAVKELLEDLPVELTCVFNCLRTKRPREMIRLLENKADRFVMTETSRPASVPAQELADKTQLPAQAVETPLEAQRTAEEMAGRNGVVLVTGSLYLLGEIRGSHPDF
jgi:folylpolyglutamate synthase/dihydrofolate synthase